MLPNPWKGVNEEKSFHNVPKAFQVLQNTVPKVAGFPNKGQLSCN
jgi:hypothetical protein